MLAAISIVGAIAIPFGDPQLIDRAIALELVFVALAVIILLDGWLFCKIQLARLALYVCVPLGIIVIIGNSLAPSHVKIMTTFSKPVNVIILITVGYALQAALIGTAIFRLVNARKTIVHERPNR